MDQHNHAAPPPHARNPGTTPEPERAPRSAPLIPDVLEPGDEGVYDRPGSGGQFGGPGETFEPRSFGGGRVQVIGCSPGCLILSIVVSVVLSVVLTLLLNLIF